MHSSRVLQLLLALSLLAPAVAPAQSLGDLARQEEARRKAIKAPGKVYTNDSLHPEPPPSSPTPATGAAAQTPSAGRAAEAAPAEPAANDPKKGEAYWKKRMADAREAVSRAQTFADALQSRINALTTDFTNRDDPAQRAQIGADRQKALDELERVKKEIADNTKKIADIQEEARKTGVPAGWVR